MGPAGREGRLTDHLTPTRRRALGAWYTPVEVAGSLVAWAFDGLALGSTPPRVLDPACGAGAFLLAARVHAPGAELVGLDVDPGAVAACAAALPEADVRRADGLDPLPTELGRFDLVVGNPPFLGQLAAATARDRSARERLKGRFGTAASGYVDTAALFLLAGLDAVGPGGRVVLILPDSVLGAAHTGPLRGAVEERAEVLGLREVDRRAFDAAVDTCALLLEHRSEPVGDRFAVDSPPANRQRIAPQRFASDSPPEGPGAGGSTWSPLLARARGVPEVRLDPSAGTLADLATATAGFRQHHYALAAHVVGHPDDGHGGDGAAPLARIATTGMVDPGHVAWGARPARIGGRSWTRPAADLTGVAADDPVVASWFRARLRPKVLVAPQTRVVEAAVDPDGTYLPATPLVSVEPRADLAVDSTGRIAGTGSTDGPADRIDPDLVPWLIAAALSAPPVTAWALDLTAGTARSRHALKLSARQVLAVPLPVDRRRWADAAAALRAGTPPADLAEDLTTAYGLDPADPVLPWYRTRQP